MNNLEDRLRELLNENAAGAPSLPASRPTIRRTRRRQAVIAVSAFLVVSAAAVLAVTALRSVPSHTTPATPTAERSINGVTMEVPAGWQFVDPVEAGLQPESNTLPRLTAILSPLEPSALLPCPNQASMRGLGFVLTLVEKPLALDGAASRPWPVSLESLAPEETVSPCFPGWDSFRAEWTAAGRTFEARLGIGPGVSEEERVAIRRAFASMAFRRQADAPTSIVLATGSTADEEWELIAAEDSDGLVLGLDWRTGGILKGGLHDRDQPIQLSSRVFGTGDSARVVVFGAVDARVAYVEFIPPPGASPESAEVIDVPANLDPELNAFVVVAKAGFPAVLRAYDAAGNLVAEENIGGPQPSPS